MTSLVNDPVGVRKNVPPPALWVLVWPAALLLSIGGLVLVIGVWIPPDFGNPDWEFGTIHSFLDGLPLALIGLGFLAAGSMVEHRGWAVGTVGVILIILAVALALTALLLAIDLPLAWRAAGPNPMLQTALKKAMAKATVQVLVMVVFCGWLGTKCLRR